MGEDMMLPDAVVVLLCIYFYLLKIGDIRYLYTSVNGLWWQHRWRSVVEAAANIVLNIFMAKYWGIHGIILATILTIFFISTLWGVQIVFKNYFGVEYIWRYYKYHAAYAAVTIMFGMITSIVCRMLPQCGKMINFLLRAVVCLVLPNIFYIVLYHRLPYFKRIKSIILRK